MPTLTDDFRQLIEYDQKSARPLLTDLVARLPKSAEARGLLAQSYLRSLEVATALEHYQAAHALEPNNLVYRQQMGLCAIAMGDYAGALKCYEEAKTIAPAEHSEAMAALMLHRLGRFQEAIQAYSALLAKLKRDHVESPHVLRGMAMLLRDVGAPLASDRFLQEFISVYRIDPGRVSGMLMERDTSIDFHGWTRFAHKADLARALNASRGKPGAPRFPDSFVLPEDRQALIDYAQREPGALYIAKPQRGTGGQGMTITREVGAVADRDGVVVQRYVERPFLVDGRKGHVRLYGLVTSLNPFRAYLYRNGIVRFAPDPYDLAEASLANVHAHVTNTALHHNRPNLVVSEDATQENVGAVWSLNAYLERIGTQGLDVEAIRGELRALVAGFLGVVAGEGLFAAQAKTSPRRAFPFKLFGLDALIDAEGKPWLIEAQRKPALGGSALVRKVNGQMFQAIFEMSCGLVFDDAMPADTDRRPRQGPRRPGPARIRDRGCAQGRLRAGAVRRPASMRAGSRRIANLRVLPMAGSRARGWLTAGPLRFRCALGPAGLVRCKREGDLRNAGRTFPSALGLFPARSAASRRGRRSAPADAPRRRMVRGPGEPALQPPRAMARPRRHRPHVARRPSLRSDLRARSEFLASSQGARQRDLLSSRAAGADAHRRLRRDFARRHAQARAPSFRARDDEDRLGPDVPNAAAAARSRCARMRLACGNRISPLRIAVGDRAMLAHRRLQDAGDKDVAHLRHDQRQLQAQR